MNHIKTELEYENPNKLFESGENEEPSDIILHKLISVQELKYAMKKDLNKYLQEWMKLSSFR